MPLQARLFPFPTFTITEQKQGWYDRSLIFDVRRFAERLATLESSNVGEPVRGILDKAKILTNTRRSLDEVKRRRSELTEELRKFEAMESQSPQPDLRVRDQNYLAPARSFDSGSGILQLEQSLRILGESP